MTTPNRYQLFLRDLGSLLHEQALDAKLEKEAAQDGDKGDYALGRLMGYYEVLSLIVSQATAFGIDLAELSISGCDPERDLL